MTKQLPRAASAQRRALHALQAAGEASVSELRAHIRRNTGEFVVTGGLIRSLTDLEARGLVQRTGMRPAGRHPYRDGASLITFSLTDRGRAAVEGETG